MITRWMRDFKFSGRPLPSPACFPSAAVKNSRPLSPPSSSLLLLFAFCCDAHVRTQMHAPHSKRAGPHSFFFHSTWRKHCPSKASALSCFFVSGAALLVSAITRERSMGHVLVCFAAVGCAREKGGSFCPTIAGPEQDNKRSCEVFPLSRPQSSRLLLVG
jgi:hypothetical protein